MRAGVVCAWGLLATCRSPARVACRNMDLRRTPEYVPQGLLHRVSHLRGPARLGKPQEVMLLQELDAHRIERIAGEENPALRKIPPCSSHTEGRLL